jgi:hypothetical protein
MAAIALANWQGCKANRCCTRQSQGNATMPIQIGAIGRTASALHPSGTVEIAGQRLDARSEGIPLGPDTPVVVIGGDSFGLLVRAVQPGEAPRIENSGQPVLTFTESMKACQEREEAERIHQRRLQRRQVLFMAGMGALVGLLVWSGAMYSHDNHEHAPLALVIALLGGVLVAPTLHGTLALFGEEFFPLMAGGGIAGAIVGAMVGVAAFGLVGAMLAAIAGAFLMPIVLFFIYSMPYWM